MYLIPTGLVIVRDDKEKSKEHIFSFFGTPSKLTLKPPSSKAEHASISHPQWANSKIEKIEFRCPLALEETETWVDALEQARDWTGDPAVPLPSFMTANWTLATEARDILFGHVTQEEDNALNEDTLSDPELELPGEGAAAEQSRRAINVCEYRRLWLEYLIHPGRQTTVRRLVHLFESFYGPGLLAGHQTSATDRPKENSTALEFFNLLSVLDCKPLERFVIIGMNIDRHQIDAWVRTHDTRLEAVQKPQQLRLFVDHLGSLIVTGVRATNRKKSVYHEQMMQALNMASLQFEDEEAAYRLQEGDAAAAFRPSFSHIEDLAYLRNGYAFRYHLLDLAVSQSTQGYALLRKALETISPQDLGRVVQNPLPGHETEACSLALAICSLDNLDAQLETLATLFGRHSVNNDMFTQLIQQGVKKQRHAMLRHMVSNFVASSPQTMPIAAAVLAKTIASELLKGVALNTADEQFSNPQDLIDFTSPMMQSLMEMLCVLIGIAPNVMLPPLVKEWFRHGAGLRERQVLCAQACHFVERDLVKLVKPNMCWFKPEAEDERQTLQNALARSARDHINERERDSIVWVITGAVHLCHQLCIEPSLVYFGRHLGREDFRSCVADRGLRTAAIAALQERVTELFPQVIGMIDTGLLMNTASFFLPTVQAAIDRTRAPGYSVLHDTYFDLLRLAERIDGYSGFDLSRLSRSGFKASKLKATCRVLNQICSVIGKLSDEQLGMHVFLQAAAAGTPSSVGFQDVTRRGQPDAAQGATSSMPDDSHLTIDSLLQCALYAADAMALLDAQIKGTNLLVTTLTHYLNNCEPHTWLSHFKKLDVIAFFIKYMVREDYNMAWTAFKAINSSVDWVGPMIDKAQQIFSQQLLDPKQLSFESDEHQLQLIEEVKVRALQQSSPEMRFILSFTAAWMKRMHGMVGIPMLPHNTQVITTLMIILFFEKLHGEIHLPEISSHFRSMLAEVGTGEGKSVIIAMLALYFVTVRGYRVHVLENNLSLRDRDYSNYRDFYGEFERPASLGGGKVETSKSLDSGADVIYCLKSALESHHMEKAPGGENPYANVVLIVDEIDDLIIDDNPTSQFVKSDSEFSSFVAPAFDELKRNGVDRATQPSGCPDRVWSMAKSAVRDAARKQKDRDYGLSSGRFRGLDRYVV
jgi:hypothetical protein